MMHRLLILGLVALMAVSLAACGRKGMPYEPEDAVYPRLYPYTPLPQTDADMKAPNNDGTAQPYQPPQPRRTRPDELKPPVDNGSPK